MSEGSWCESGHRGLLTVLRFEGGFFRLLRSATILGYFSSEPIGKNVLHYDPVPGAYDGCVPIDQVGRRYWTT